MGQAWVPRKLIRSPSSLFVLIHFIGYQPNLLEDEA